MNPDYCSNSCKGNARTFDRRPYKESLFEQVKKMDVVNSFCCLGDTIGAGGGCDLSVIVRIRSAWGKFWKLLPKLTLRALSNTIHGQTYNTYNHPVLLYASEYWAPSVPAKTET